MNTTDRELDLLLAKVASANALTEELIESVVADSPLRTARRNDRLADEALAYFDSLRVWVRS